MARRRTYKSATQASQVYARLTFDERVTERAFARMTRPRQNQAYVDKIPRKTFNRIHELLDAHVSMKHISRRLGIPHNIVVYIWEHRNE